MSGRIVLFGATGYTGRLVAREMVRRGLRPVLAARSLDKLEMLAEELGQELELQPADVDDPPSVRGLVERGDVLVSTVGPFMKHGAPALAAAVTAGAHYLDSTGEPPFIRDAFEFYGPVAAKNECGLLTAFGYDFVPGNLAGALALDRAGAGVERVDVGYFTTGSAGAGSVSGGTRASLLGVALEEGFALRDGRVRGERGAARMRSFEVDGQERQAVSVGGSEHFGLPRVEPALQEVDVYLGWFGPASRALQLGSALSGPALKLPGARTVWTGLADRLAKGSSGGPDDEALERTGSHVTAVAYGAGGRELSSASLVGAGPYPFTSRILAWGAERAAEGDLLASGALGPVDAFGLEQLRGACAEAGLADPTEASEAKEQSRASA